MPRFAAYLPVTHNKTLLHSLQIPVFPVFPGIGAGRCQKWRTKSAQNLHALAITCAQIVHVIKISLHELCTLTPQIAHKICIGFWLYFLRVKFLL
jgi:hypothetical protein